MKIELHLFTNCTKFTPSTRMIRDTYNSFKKTFGNIPVAFVWCDPKPYVAKYKAYVRNLLKNFSKVVQTVSLSDGYIKAIKNSKADYLFMLEHDWIFQTELINNSLNEILEIMNTYEIYHLRFNKRQNIVTKWDRFLQEQKCGDFVYCRTPILSNNPHIIHRKTYLDFIKKGMIRVMLGSDGVEEIISKFHGTWGAIYGGLDYPATVQHIDGRRGKR